jgi:hypothetical protein
MPVLIVNILKGFLNISRYEGRERLKNADPEIAQLVDYKVNNHIIMIEPDRH